MKRTPFATILIVIVVLLSMTLACGALNLNNLVGGGDNYKSAAELWSDVPRMDGLTPSELEDLPLPVKLLMRTVLGNLGRLNPQGEDQTTGNIDWIAFNSTGTPDDVKNFYTPDLMAANGWERSEQSTCVNGSDQGVSQVGVFCVFGKNQNALETYLAIIASQDENTKQTSVFFLRLERAATTPTP